MAVPVAAALPPNEVRRGAGKHIANLPYPCIPITRRSHMIGAYVVLHPLIHVPVHVIQTERIRRERTHWRRLIGPTVPAERHGPRSADRTILANSIPPTSIVSTSPHAPRIPIPIRSVTYIPGTDSQAPAYPGQPSVDALCPAHGLPGRRRRSATIGPCASPTSHSICPPN